MPTRPLQAFLTPNRQPALRRLISAPALTLGLALWAALPGSLRAQAATAPAASVASYPGTITLRVDATDLDHKVLAVRQTLPVRAGPLQLFFPRWLPGQHAPNGDVTRLAGLKISARGQPLAWMRDPLDTHSFRVEVPAGTSALDIEFQHLSPVTRDSGRVIVTREMLNVQWNDLLLYPAGFEARSITVQAGLTLPAGWSFGTALRSDSRAGDSVQFKPVTLEMLVDSPVFAGRHFKRIELDPPGTARPVALNLVADAAEPLKASESQIEAHRELVRQADKLFGARHYGHYEFLLALTDEMGGIGLEHHQSSENGVRPNYFADWDKRIGARELLPHEYVHSWNGKFRRPADLNTPHFNVPMQNSLLWVYEGMTQYWGWVLTARSGLGSAEHTRERLAQNAANFEARVGRTWRNLQDTTHDSIMALRQRNQDWGSWQRNRGDYYGESLLIWLDADTLIRERSGGTKSLDDFARAFFGVRDGELGPLTYRFDDLVAALNGVLPHDWAAFLRQRLDTNTAAAPLDGLARGGWKLAWSEVETESSKRDEGPGSERAVDLSHSLGLQVGGMDSKLSNVAWGGPAYAAGVAPGATLVAVNGMAYRPPLLKAAVVANKDGKAPIELLLREGERFRTVRIDYRGGLRYPKLERIEGSADRLAGVLARR
jgi:predicted metalloprotease with PDZ domain